MPLMGGRLVLVGLVIGIGASPASTRRCAAYRRSRRIRLMQPSRWCSLVALGAGISRRAAVSIRWWHCDRNESLIADH
jgi:hypothetical protein